MRKQGKGGLHDIYVVGCGPSLKGFQWSLLDNLSTIAVNAALRNVPNADYFITSDSRFARMAVQHRFWKSKAFKVLVMGENHHFWHKIQRISHHFDVRVTPTRFHGDIGFTWGEFCTGQNSGFCGMQLAVLLGAKVIHLLGIDLSNENGGHYHNWYSAPGKERLNEFLEHFRKAVIILNKADIKVVSRSAISRLNDVVPYVPMERTIDGPQVAAGGEPLHGGDGIRTRGT